jgi:ribosome biogenesis GTPase
VFRLEDLGWGPFFQQQLHNHETTDLLPARVVEENRGAYRLYGEAGWITATISGRLRHEALMRGALPAAGDWVLVDPPSAGNTVIQRLLERRTNLSRKEAGERTGEQILAANVDTVFLVSALNEEFNPRRIERYLAAVWQSGARPVVVVNKADLGEDPELFLRQTETIAPGVPVLLTSTITGAGIDALRARIGAGETAVFVGSSGVGKSSLINALLDQAAQPVREIRDDGKGRHTTTSRRLILLSGGGVVIDTPGLRELALWNSDAGLGGAFADIESLASECAFRDCRHAAEPGCAVRDAMESGTLAEERVGSYRKLERELDYIAEKQDESLRIARANRWKAIAKQHRQREKARAKYGRAM